MACCEWPGWFIRENLNRAAGSGLIFDWDEKYDSAGNREWLIHDDRCQWSCDDAEALGFVVALDQFVFP